MNYEGDRQLYIIMDQGGHASRAVIMDQLGQTIARAERPLKTFRPREGFVEHDPGELVQTIRQSLEGVLQKAGAKGSMVQAAGFATQRSSIACWDSETGEAFSPIISWQDTRAGDQVAGMAGWAEEVHTRTGLFLSAHYGASKLRWCMDHLPAVTGARDQRRLLWGPLAASVLWSVIFTLIALSRFENSEF